MKFLIRDLIEHCFLRLFSFVSKLSHTSDRQEKFLAIFLMLAPIHSLNFVIEREVIVLHHFR